MTARSVSGRGLHRIILELREGWFARRKTKRGRGKCVDPHARGIIACAGGHRTNGENLRKIVYFVADIYKIISHFSRMEQIVNLIVCFLMVSWVIFFFSSSLNFIHGNLECSCNYYYFLCCQDAGKCQVLERIGRCEYVLCKRWNRFWAPPSP